MSNTFPTVAIFHFSRKKLTSRKFCAIKVLWYYPKSKQFDISMAYDKMEYYVCIMEGEVLWIIFFWNPTEEISVILDTPFSWKNREI